MELRLTKKVADAIGLAKFVKFGIPVDRWGYRYENADLNLRALSKEKRTELRKLLVDNAKVRGTGGMVRDMDVWEEALTDTGRAKSKTVRNFHALAIRYIGALEGHRVYEKADVGSEVWLPHFVHDIHYTPENKSKEHYHPAYVTIRMSWETFGGVNTGSETFYANDCIGKTVSEALADKGYYGETTALREKYLTETKRWVETTGRVGTQFLAVGVGTDDLDGNNKRNDSWYWRRTNRVQMDKDGEPARVVIDVFCEDEEARRGSSSRSDGDTSGSFWWAQKNMETIEAMGEDEDVELEDVLEDADLDRPQFEIPIHPYCAVFCLKRHLRIKIHIAQLTEYKYDAKLIERLILPSELKDLVRVLVEHSEGGFTDIVHGKSGGAVVLLTGQPGVGKTLTAEVYAESEGRALYSVQCSQLGTDPESLEDELLKVFARAKRWNAVMLLDEADVYVRQRASDLAQNAIVGVFLRVLEYQSSVLFLTTNRPEDVDDAIASRCVARLNYAVPSADDQKRIWQVLSKGTGVNLSDDVIADIVTKNPGMSGRDVKNLLKLAMLMSQSKKEPITAKTIEFVKRFKPTGATALNPKPAAGTFRMVRD